MTLYDRYMGEYPHELREQRRVERLREDESLPDRILREHSELVSSVLTFGTPSVFQMVLPR